MTVRNHATSDGRELGKMFAKDLPEFQAAPWPFSDGADKTA